MNPIRINVPKEMENLAFLAMKFRGTRRDKERRDIREEYSQTVERLIQSGKWHEMPAPEDQLPDDWMPKAFFQYWLEQSTP